MNQTVAIEVRDLTMAYGGRVVMRDLSFQVRRGEIFVIAGGSGSGKSTLLKHMLGLIRPAAGEIRVGGAVVDSCRDALRHPRHGAR